MFPGETPISVLVDGFIPTLQRPRGKDIEMTKLDDAIMGSVRAPMDNAWHTYMENLFAAMQKMEQTVSEAAEMPMDCTEAWCTNARALLDDLNHQLFSIHEPKWSTDQDSARIKSMKRKVYDIYARLAHIETQISK
jgi:hypothetical protein